MPGPERLSAHTRAALEAQRRLVYNDARFEPVLSKTIEREMAQPVLQRFIQTAEGLVNSYPQSNNPNQTKLAPSDVEGVNWQIVKHEIWGHLSRKFLGNYYTIDSVVTSPHTEENITLGHFSAGYSLNYAGKLEFKRHGSHETQPSDHPPLEEVEYALELVEDIGKVLRGEKRHTGTIQAETPAKRTYYRVPDDVAEKFGLL